MRRFDRIVACTYVFSYIAIRSRFARFRAQLGNDVSHIMLCETMGRHMSETYGMDDRIHVRGNSGFVAERHTTSPRQPTCDVVGFLSQTLPHKGIRSIFSTPPRSHTAFHRHTGPESRTRGRSLLCEGD